MSFPLLPRPPLTLPVTSPEVECHWTWCWFQFGTNGAVLSIVFFAVFATRLGLLILGEKQVADGLRGLGS